MDIRGEIRRGLRRLRGMWQRPLRTRRARAYFGRAPRPYKLHVGCGSVHMDGWVNIDRRLAGTKADVAWDLRKPLPVDAGSCALIYSEHVQEHLSAEAGVRFLAECRRVLQPGGVVRIAMPSLEDRVESYRAGDARGHPTRAEMLNALFRRYGHKWIYDREELHRRMREAGFRTIRDVAWGESTVPELRNLETHDSTGLICEAVRA